MDECLSYLYEAEQLMQEYVDLDDYEVIFEADQDTQKNNAQIEDKSESLVRKAINVVKAILEKIRTVINNIFDYFGHSKEERSAFKKFEEECKRNPEFANMKVTIKNWQEMNNAYDEVLRDAEAEYDRIKDDDMATRSANINKLTSKLKGLAGGITKTVTVETAIKMAQGSRRNAQRINDMIKYDNMLLDKLTDTLGKKEAKKFKRKINALSSRVGLRRWIAGARKNQASSCAECLKETIQAINPLYAKTKMNSNSKQAAAADLEDSKALVKSLKEKLKTEKDPDKRKALQEQLSQAKDYRSGARKDKLKATVGGVKDTVSAANTSRRLHRRGRNVSSEFKDVEDTVVGIGIDAVKDSGIIGSTIKNKLFRNGKFKNNPDGVIAYMSSKDFKKADDKDKLQFAKAAQKELKKSVSLFRKPLGSANLKGDAQLNYDKTVAALDKIEVLIGNLNHKLSK